MKQVLLSLGFIFIGSCTTSMDLYKEKMISASTNSNDPVRAVWMGFGFFRPPVQLRRISLSTPCPSDGLRCCSLEINHYSMRKYFKSYSFKS